METTMSNFRYVSKAKKNEAMGNIPDNKLNYYNISKPQNKSHEQNMLNARKDYEMKIQMQHSQDYDFM